MGDIGHGVYPQRNLENEVLRECVWGSLESTNKNFFSSNTVSLVEGVWGFTPRKLCKMKCSDSEYEISLNQQIQIFRTALFHWWRAWGFTPMPEAILMGNNFVKGGRDTFRAERDTPSTLEMPLVRMITCWNINVFKCVPRSGKTNSSSNLYQILALCWKINDIEFSK